MTPLFEVSNTEYYKELHSYKETYTQSLYKHCQSEWDNHVNCKSKLTTGLNL